MRDESAILRSVRNIVQTIPTEKFFNSLFGSDVRGTLFDFIDFGSASTIADQIEVSINNFEPRVDNLQVIVNPRPDQNAFDVNVTYDIIWEEFPTQEYSFLRGQPDKMPFTKFTNQILINKRSIKDYLRANSNFTGFDFEG